MPKARPAKTTTPLRRSRAAASLSRDEIVKVLEAEILSGALPPGVRIDERELGERFNVSRMPVRDAVGRLASLGLIDVRPRSGSYVSVMDASDLIQLFELMGNIETICARYSALRMTSDERSELMVLARACEDANDGRPEAYVKENHAFHDAIYRGAKNKFLETMARQTRQRIGSYRNYSFDLPGRLKLSSDEHVAIASAILAGDATTAQKLMELHTDIKRDDFVPLVTGMRERALKSKPTADPSDT